MSNGYLHPAYATSLSEYGTPRHLPLSGTWVLVRRIEGTPYYDGRGLYPLTCCRDWSRLGEDMASLEDLVSLVFVADPFGHSTTEDLLFLDKYSPYKYHCYVDTKLPCTPSEHHLRAAKRARERLDHVTYVPHPHCILDDWMRLYSNLIDHHNIEGIATFSESAFATQLRVPGIAAWVATLDQEIVSILLWYIQSPWVAYYHLGASSQKGYEVGASHALFQAAITSLNSHVRYISLGGSSGLSQKEDGLTRFKKGWAPITRTSYLCGKILRPDIYENLSKDTEGEYFPLYRTPQEEKKI